MFSPGILLGNVFSVIALVLRQVSGRQTKLKGVISIAMIATLVFYETFFTSMFVVPIHTENNPGFADLLKSGYRMAYFEQANNTSVVDDYFKYYEYYEYDFKQLGIYEWIKDSKYFFLVKRNESLDRLVTNQTLKVMVPQSIFSLLKHVIKSYVESQNVGEDKCRFTQEEFNKLSVYEMAFVNLRVEIISILGSIREFGFYKFWDDIYNEIYISSNKHSMLLSLRANKVFADNTETLKVQDLIRVSNLLSLFLIFGVGLIIALGIFITESSHGCTRMKVVKQFNTSSCSVDLIREMFVIFYDRVDLFCNNIRKNRVTITKF